MLRTFWRSDCLCVVRKYESKLGPYLLSIANEHTEPRTDFAIGAKQQSADIRHKRTDCLICCIWFVIQSESHTQTRQVTLLHLEHTEHPLSITECHLFYQILIMFFHNDLVYVCLTITMG